MKKKFYNLGARSGLIKASSDHFKKLLVDSSPLGYHLLSNQRFSADDNTSVLVLFRY